MANINKNIDQLEVSVVIIDKNQFEASIATQKKEEIKEEISTG